MKIRETEYHVHEDDDLQDSINQWMEEDGVDDVRVEIHSLNDPPWPMERPEGWGVGWWCRIEEWRPFGSTIRSVVVIYIFSSGTEIAIIQWVDIETGEIGLTQFDMIHRFGPRAEVPG